MVRRAEYALGKAIRKGQAEGTILKKGENRTPWNRWNGAHRQEANPIPGPTDYASQSELSGGNPSKPPGQGAKSPPGGDLLPGPGDFAVTP